MKEVIIYEMPYGAGHALSIDGIQIRISDEAAERLSIELRLSITPVEPQDVELIENILPC